MPDPERARRARLPRGTRATHSSLGSSRIFLGRGRRRHTVAAHDADDRTTAQGPAAAGASGNPATAAAAEPGAENRAARSARSRLARALSNPGRGQILVAVLLLVFGVGITMQVRSMAEDSTYTNARRGDLIQLLDGLTQENHRLENELSDLRTTRGQLQSGTDAQAVARTEAEKRISVLSILAGTAPAEGPGIKMVITDPQHKVSPQILLDAIEEMRDAGGEVIEINNSVRLVASSWFGTDASGGLVVDGQPVTRPITIEVIGDPHNLEEGANFRGGIVSEITSSRVGGKVVITRLNKVEITSLHTAKQPQYARPATPEPTR